MELKPGSRWKSAVCDAAFVVVRAPGGDVALACGGQPVVSLDGEIPTGLAIDPALSDGTLMGKRYEDVESGLELLVTKAGTGTLAVDGVVLPLKDAKPLPASD